VSNELVKRAKELSSWFPDDDACIVLLLGLSLRGHFENKRRCFVSYEFVRVSQVQGNDCLLIHLPKLRVSPGCDRLPYHGTLYQEDQHNGLFRSTFDPPCFLSMMKKKNGSWQLYPHCEPLHLFLPSDFKWSCTGSHIVLDLFWLASMQQKNICCSIIAFLAAQGRSRWIFRRTSQNGIVTTPSRKERSLDDKMAAEMYADFVVIRRLL
jgi:hypothetical protein